MTIFKTDHLPWAKLGPEHNGKTITHSSVVKDAAMIGKTVSNVVVTGTSGSFELDGVGHSWIHDKRPIVVCES